MKQRTKKLHDQTIEDLRRASQEEPSPFIKPGTFVIARGVGAGVHMGTYVGHEGQEIVLNNSRRIWYWEGAASLHGMAAVGVTAPQNCKFSDIVERHHILDGCEILEVTPKAQAILESVPIWQAPGEIAN